MDLFVAFSLGLVGSLHCAGMCGPLALALPANGAVHLRFFAGRIAYNLGRTITYAAIGGIFGFLGQRILMAGFQRTLSIGLGVGLLLGWLALRYSRAGSQMTRGVGVVTRQMAGFLKRNSILSLLVIGLLNGLLPCGLVYAAAVGAASTASTLKGAVYMAAFGAGTIPMLLTIALSGRLVPLSWRAKLMATVPAAVIVLSTLLILRGMSLGIPYLSPDLSATSSCCSPGQ